MIKYEAFKKWLLDNKEAVVLGACYVLVFIIGFGSGRFDREYQRKQSGTYSNYNTNFKLKPADAQGANREAAEDGKAEAAGAKDEKCLIKGNISSAGKKIYHIPGGAFYKTVKPEQCFKTEADAKAGGFAKSGR